MSDSIRIQSGNALIVVAPITGCAEESYGQLLTRSDREYLDSIRSEARRAAGSAWRAMVRGEGEMSVICYDDVGAPYLTQPSRWKHIGVSHSARHAAVIFSDSRCAIDIESVGRNYDRLARRYISDEENSLPQAANPLFKAAVWCAKEALYKYSGRRGVDFLGDLRVTAIDFQRNILQGAIREVGGHWIPCALNMLETEGDLVVYTVQ